MPAPELNPLQQTIFEEGPKAGFVPPESINMYKETPTQFGQQPIGVEGADIDWYALGESGFKIANETFGAVVNNLISSKGNAIAELKDVYSTKLNNAYIELNTKQAEARAKGIAIDQPIMDSLISRINEYKTEWNDKARDVVENNQGGLFEPAIDYWDPELDIKSLGSRYQELALRVRSSDRDISAASTKLLFDAQFNNIGKQKKEFDAKQAKFGAVPYKAGDTANLVLAGASPLNAVGSQYPPVSPTDPTNTPYFFTQLKDGKLTPKVDAAGNQVVILDPATGQWLWNSAASQDGLNENETKQLVDYAQFSPYAEYRDRSAIASHQGMLAPDSADVVKFVFSKPIATRSPQEMFRVALMLNQLPVSTLSDNLKEIGLNEEDMGMAIVLRDAVQKGGTMQTLSELKNITAADIGVVNEILTFAQQDSPYIKGAATKATTLVYLNNIVRPLVGQALGLNDKQLTDLLVELNGDTVKDAGGPESLVRVLKNNPQLLGTALRAMAYVEANRRQFLVEGRAGDLDASKVAAFAATFNKTLANHRGITAVKGADGSMVSAESPDLSYTNTLKPENTKLNIFDTHFASSYSTDDLTNPTAVRDSAIKTAKGLVPDLNERLYTSFLDNMVVNQPNGLEDKTQVSRVIPVGEQGRLAVACSAAVMKLNGYVPVIGATAEADFAAQLAAVKKGYAQIPPMSEWGIEYSVSPREQGFMTSSTGGLPLGYRRIMMGNVDVLPYLTPASQIDSNGVFTPRRNDGTPILRVPASRDNGGAYRMTLENLESYKITKTPSYTIVPSSEAAGILPQEMGIIMRQAEPQAVKAVARAFANQDKLLLANMTADEASTIFIVNADKIMDIVEADPRLKQIKYLLQNDITGEKKTAVFSQENFGIMFEDAKKKGITTVADFISYTLGVAVAKLENRQDQSDFMEAAAENAYKRSLLSGGPPMPIHEGDSVVQAGPAAGMSLYRPNSDRFVRNMDSSARGGSNIWKQKDSNVFYVYRAGEDVDTTEMEPYFEGRKPNEDEATYTARFNSVFGSILTDNKNKEAAKRTSLEMIGRSSAMPIEASIQKKTVLPSSQIAAFTKSFIEFMDNNRLVGLNSPASLLEMKTYDFTGLYFDTGELPKEWSDLPQQYALPGNSRYIKPYQTKTFGQAMDTAASELIPALSDAVGALPDAAMAIPNAMKETGTGPDAFQQAGQNMMQQGYDNLKASLLKEAMVGGDIDSVLAQTVGDPVAILRTRDEDVKLSQDSANFLLTAFDKDLSTKVIAEVLKGTKQPMYGVSKDTYMKVIADVVAKKWEPAALEYQIRLNIKRDRLLKERQGSKVRMTFDEAVAGVDSTSFPLAPSEEKQWVDSALKAWNVYQESQVKSVLDEKDSGPQERNRKRQEATKEFEMKLRDPRQFIDLRQDFLMHWLLPQSRTTKYTPDQLWIKTITKRLLEK
jgi:hypothetical protein